MKLLDRFLAATEHSMLGQRKVARELVFLLIHYRRLTPPVLQGVALKLGMSQTIESGEQLARWLQDDGWVQHTEKPWVGKGMSAVWAYEPTEKWHKLVDEAECEQAAG